MLPVLLSASLDERIELYIPAHIESPDPLGSVQLVGRNGQQVHSEFFDIDRDLPESLYCVRMKQSSVFVRDRG